MKNILKAIICLPFLTGLSSCDDFLTIIPEDRQVLETYYISEEAINNNTASLYTGYSWQDFDASFMWLAGDLMSGDLYYTYDQEGQFYYMSFNAGNKYLNQGWNGLYRVISYCNNIINGMPQTARSNGVSETVIERALAEARCVRGIAYYILTEYWNDIPIVTDNNMSSNDVIRYTQNSVYKFIQKDLEYAKDILPAAPFATGRCSKWTAIGMLAKLHLTMASHLSDSESADNFALAKNYAADVIENSGLEPVDLAGLKTMFYPQGENNVESLFAIQCITYNYGSGNTRNAHHARFSGINSGNAWGTGKGPTLSLQESFENGDARRPLTFMRVGDHYDNLGGGGYTYVNASGPLDPAPEQSPNEVLAHIRKYVIGTNADCDGQAGSNQDAGNNLYLLRLSDVYLCYVEACIGSGTSTDDALALSAFKKIRNRAGLSFTSASITYDQLIKERRTEFAFESINFFDIKRMYYRDQDKAINYMNNMKRERMYYVNSEYNWQDMNAANTYHGGFTPLLPEDDPTGKGSIFYLNKDAAAILFTAGNFVLPVPAETVTKTPNINNEPVEYQF